MEKTNILHVNKELCGQRLDNFLIKKLKGLPKSLIYKLVRSGQVRVNEKRTKVSYRITDKDLIRVPPYLIHNEIMRMRAKLREPEDFYFKELVKDEQKIKEHVLHLQKLPKKKRKGRDAEIKTDISNLQDKLRKIETARKRTERDRNIRYEINRLNAVQVSITGLNIIQSEEKNMFKSFKKG